MVSWAAQASLVDRRDGATGTEADAWTSTWPARDDRQFEVGQELDEDIDLELPLTPVVRRDLPPNLRARSRLNYPIEFTNGDETLETVPPVEAHGRVVNVVALQSTGDLGADFELSNSKIDGTMKIAGSGARLTLIGAQFGELDVCADDFGTPSLEESAGLRLYSVGSELRSRKKAAAWLASGTYAPSAWTQVALAHENVGQSDSARWIRSRGAAQIRRTTRNPLRFASSLISGALTGHGYYPIRTAAWLALLIIGTALLADIGLRNFPGGRVVGCGDLFRPPRRNHILRTASSGRNYCSRLKSPPSRNLLLRVCNISP